jgi:DNA (cytosine-5)-methyltransferase 1
VITVREAARLQGFPDEHKFHDTIWHSFRMIGNSVSPIIAKEILSVVADAIEEGPMAAAA